MRSQGLTGLSEPIAPSEIALRYALSTLTKRTDFNFYLFLIKKVKVSHSLIAVGAVGVRVPLYLGHS